MQRATQTKIAVRSATEPLTGGLGPFARSGFVFSTAVPRSLGAPVLSWQQPSHQVQVRQRKQRQRPHRVLVQTPIAYFGKAPQVLDDLKRVLPACAMTRPRAVDRLLPLGQHASGLGAAVDSIGNARVAALPPMILGPVRLVTENLPLLSMQQFVQPGDVALRGWAAHHAMHQPMPVGADMQLHPEVPLLALADLLHLRSRCCAAFLVDGGAAMIVASTMVPDFSSSFLSSSS